MVCFFASVELPSHLLYSFLACPVDMEHGQTPPLPQPSKEGGCNPVSLLFNKIPSEVTTWPALFPLLFFCNCVYLFLAVLGLCCFSLIAGSEGCSPVEVLGILAVVASLVAERRLWSTQASVAVGHGLSNCGSQALEHRLK